MYLLQPLWWLHLLDLQSCVALQNHPVAHHLFEERSKSDNSSLVDQEQLVEDLGHCLVEKTALKQNKTRLNLLLFAEVHWFLTANPFVSKTDTHLISPYTIKNDKQKCEENEENHQLRVLDLDV